jgi:hypothetical protein
VGAVKLALLEEEAAMIDIEVFRPTAKESADIDRLATALNKLSPDKRELLYNRMTEAAIARLRKDLLMGMTRSAATSHPRAMGTRAAKAPLAEMRR